MATKKPRPEHDEQQLYGRETELIDTHGVDDLGPDPGQFPTSSDRQPTGTEASGSGSEESHREPVRRERARPEEGGGHGREN